VYRPPMSRVIDFGGRAALVVGGGGGGIGTAVALALAEAGCDVGSITVVPEHAADTERQVRELGRQAIGVVADVTDDEALIDAIAAVANAIGPIRHLVNVVGGALADDWWRTSEYDLDAFDRIVARNVRYAVLSCRQVARALIDTGQTGSMVNTSSIAARGSPLLAAYGASKAALESFSRTMALEWGPYGIRVNLVAPGTVKTPRAGTDDLSEAAKGIPLRRRGEPRDIADAALFLLSDHAAYVTGHTLVVDGGASIGGPGGDGLPAFVTNPIVRARFG
jgi:3-oxoacyl-[acyl-carrier protein] reductase